MSGGCVVEVSLPAPRACCLHAQQVKWVEKMAEDAQKHKQINKKLKVGLFASAASAGQSVIARRTAHSHARAETYALSLRVLRVASSARVLSRRCRPCPVCTRGLTPGALQVIFTWVDMAQFPHVNKELASAGGYA